MPLNSASAGFHRHAENLWADNRCWGRDPLPGNLLEPGMFKVDPGFAVGVAAIAQPLPKRGYQILKAPQAGSPRRSHVLDEQEPPTRFQDAQYLFKAALRTRDAAEDERADHEIHATVENRQ